MQFEQATGINASIDIREGTYRSRIQGIANTNFHATAADGGITFEDDIWFRSANGQVVLSANGGGQSLNVDGDALLWAESVTDPTAGSVSVTATEGAAISIAGGLAARARGFGVAGIQADGGTININADGGEITAGTIKADASAWGGNPDFEDGSSDAEGGGILLHAANGGTLTSGNVTANVSAFGGFTNGDGDGVAGNGTGGGILVHSELRGRSTSTALSRAQPLEKAETFSSTASRPGPAVVAPWKSAPTLAASTWRVTCS